MNQFMIGQYGSYDEKKHKRDFRPDFLGVEACMMQSNEDIEKLCYLKDQEGVRIGIHFPLRSGQWDHRDPQYLSNDQATRRLSYCYMEKEFHYAAAIKPDYVLVHYPKPVVLDSHVDWMGWNWKFGHPSEYVFSTDLKESKFRDRSKAFFEWFSTMAQRLDFRPVIELDAIPLYLSGSDFFFDLLDQYPDIEVCVDIGRLHLQDSIDQEFDAFQFLERILPWVREVHLWNVQVTDRVANGHYPALPGLAPEDGWADIQRYFAILRKAKTPLRILFEHDSTKISDTELDDCYRWIQDLMSNGEKRFGIKGNL